MLSNDPFFVDISTYSPKKTMSFYKHVFAWAYYKSDAYYTAFFDNNEVAGLYETPEKFKQMRMPHFWMTYFQVSNLDDTVNKAQQLGGIIELNYLMNDFGKIALIRDPQGAGFTVYEGNKLKNVRTNTTKNTLIWNELHVSNIQNTIPFYEGLFNWTIVKNQKGFYKVLNSKEKHIADILDIPNQYKGKYEYWVCTFGVESLSISKKRIQEYGGTLITQEPHRLLCSDNSNEAFFYIKEV